jgi:hypothetical protein
VCDVVDVLRTYLGWAWRALDPLGRLVVVFCDCYYARKIEAVDEACMLSVGYVHGVRF